MEPDIRFRVHFIDKMTSKQKDIDSLINTSTNFNEIGRVNVQI